MTAYKQTRSFNQGIAGRIKGFCLQNVRRGFSIPAKYLTANAAWANTQQHRDRNIPTGVDVPLFYSYKTAGHVNVRKANGQVWSDGDVYASLQAYEKTHTTQYLGWGESLNGVRIIEAVASPAPSNGWAGKTVYLSAAVSSWRVYVPGTRTVKATLNPKKYGGLSYKIQGTDSLGRALIDTTYFGRVALPIDSDATIK